MANWTTLKTAVNNVIKTNGSQQITGQALQNVLNNIITSLGGNYTFIGVANPTTNPGTPDGKVYYEAKEGIYPNFGGIEVNKGEMAYLKWDGTSWHKETSAAVTIIGDVNKLTTINKIIVDAINEINVKDIVNQSIDPASDITSEYIFEQGQSYGEIGGKIQTGIFNTWTHTKLYKEGKGKRVQITIPPTSRPSSVIQYVDDSENIVSLDGTGLSGGESYNFDLVFPAEASAVYVSGDEGKIRIFDMLSSELPPAVNIIGNVNTLTTENKILVDAINEANMRNIVYQSTGTTYKDISEEYTIEQGQSYGEVGGKIQTSSPGIWEHIKIAKDGRPLMVNCVTPPSSNPSSIIQYVDDFDNIISLEGVKLGGGREFSHELSFPEGATAVYVSGDKNMIQVMDMSITLPLPAINIIGDVNKLLTENKVLVDAINELRLASKPTTAFRFRVLSWNIGHYAKGNNTSSLITSETYESQKKQFREVFNRYAADIVGLCEYSSIFFENETASDAILCQYPHQYIAPTEKDYVGTALYSAFSLSSLTEFSLGTNKAYEGRFFANEKEVIVCMCHVPWGAHNDNLSALNTIISRYADNPYVVVMGDFNWSAGREEECAKLFTDSGYQIANWGYMGKILTSYNNVIASNYLDNVAVKGGCILHTEVLQNTPEGLDPDNPSTSDESLWDSVNLSDHFPVICDISI